MKRFPEISLRSRVFLHSDLEKLRDKSAGKVAGNCQMYIAISSPGGKTGR